MSSLVFAQQEQTDKATKATDEFAARFFDEANIRDYIAKVDTLIEQAESTVFASSEEMKDKIPGITTANGIKIAYSIRSNPDVGEVHHVSISRTPQYLATAFGTNLVGLFAERTGFVFPPAAYEVSQNNVYHAIWLVPVATLTEDKAAITQRREKNRKLEDPKKIFINAVKNGVTLQKQSKGAASKPANASPTTRKKQG
ncbi:hypothetical protein CKA38_15005 [Ereboglobus luteus]|uniref:Uncharacterized protein n=2 Tax=Ereboglobus luteus TaxID=1796921 RepID=A0A2U8E6E4_9BACT|nr:hypothetical protein CKA38_15005 [Ereboglobus luteus]